VNDVPARSLAMLLRHAPHVLLVAASAGLLLALGLRVSPLIALVAALVSCTAAAISLRRGDSNAAFWLLVAALAAAGWGWGSARLSTTTPPAVATQSMVGVVDVDTQPQQTARGLRVRVRVVALAAGQVPIGSRLLADLPPRAPRMRLGMRLRVTGRLVPAATARSPDWWRAYLERSTIAGRLDLHSVHVIGARGGLPGLRDRVRNAATEAVGSGLSGERRAVVRGMALGGGAGLSEATAQSLRDAGVWHLLAVSGQNVAMVGIAIMALLGALGCAKRPATVIALMALVAYCLVCDGGASVVRAGIMGGLGIVAELRSRDRQRWYLLLVGLAVLLIHQPRAIGDPGLQLSFAAVAGMFLIAPPIAEWCGELMPKRLANLIAQAAAATIATSPVVIWHFGRLSLAGLVVNLVAVPLAAAIVVLALSGIALGAVIAPLGVAIGWVTGLGAGLLIWLARAASSVPGATVALPGWAAGAGALIAIAVVLGLRRMRAVRGPPIAMRVPRGALIAAVAALIAGVAVAIPARRPPEPWPEQAAVTALDIGQGDAILLRSPDGAAALIDTGPPGPTPPVERALRRAGVRRLDVMAITHDQLDHSGAARAVLDDVPVGTFATPVAVPAITSRARRHGIPVRSIAAGDVIQVGVWRLDVLWPLPGFTPPPDANDAALVVLARAPGISALLTADAESNVLTRLRLRHVDVLKVSHHGSADSGLADVLRRLTPTSALISVGAGNSYGHPVPSTLDTLARASVHVERTDRSGSVTAVGGPAGVTLYAERE
jgi:competence protein ComEC